MSGDSNHTKGNTMTEYNEGDLVEAVKGNTAIRGPLVNIWGLGRSLYLKLTLGLVTDIIHLEANGYKITVIEKAPPKVVLPTEPGFYVTAYNDPDVFELTKAGSWFYGPKSIPVDRVIHDGGNYLRRLEPVGETAKKVLKALDDFAEEFGVATSANRRIYNDGWNAVATEFGVEL